MSTTIRILSADEAFLQDVEGRAAAMTAEYRRYCLGEDADPEGYLERMRYLREEFQQAADRDPAELAALSSFLERVAMEEEGP